MYVFGFDIIFLLGKLCFGLNFVVLFCFTSDISSVESQNGINAGQLRYGTALAALQNLWCTVGTQLNSINVMPFLVLIQR